MKIDNEVIAKSDVDEDGGYDLKVDLNQIGIAEDATPPEVIQAGGFEFDLCGQVVDTDDVAIYWSYWNEGNLAVNLQLHFA
jgi:hypothetical protein